MVESQSVVAPMNHEPMTIQVHEIEANYDQLPERFIYKDDEEYGNITNACDSSQTAIPVIDISLLTSSHSELDKLRSALSTWGCFQILYIKIQQILVTEGSADPLDPPVLREISKLFFNLSAEEKRKCLREENDIEGYGNDMILSDHQTLDWTDRLFLTVLPQDQQRLQFWPQNPTNFREVVHEYCCKIALINELVLKAMARSLSLEENCFLEQYGKTNSKMLARFNYYPPCPWAEKVLGLKPHSDGSAITFLLQDKELEGLQMLKDGHWFQVPIVPDALTINIGDQIEIMSNGVFKSPIHRVLVNAKNQRITVAMFCMPQIEKDIGPIEGLITDDTPRLYKNVTFSLDFYLKNYQEGTRSIDACKI